MKKCLVLAVLAGAAVPAMAQVVPIAADEHIDGMRIVDQRGTYSERAPQYVYDNLTNTFTVGLLSSLAGTNSKHHLIRINLCPGPGCNPSPTNIVDFSGVSWGVRTGAGQLWDFDVVQRYWHVADVDQTRATGMIASGAVPIAERRYPQVQFGDAAGAFFWQVTPAIGGNVTLNPGEQSVYVETMITVPGGTVPIPNGLAPYADNLRLWVTSNSGQQGATSNPATAGSPLINFGFDFNSDGVFTGSATVSNTAPSEHRGYALVTTPANSNVSYALRLQADVSAPPPATLANLGCIADTGLVRTGDSVGASAANWYELCLNGDAYDAVRQFLNVTTEGSAGDVSIALYDNSGGVAGVVGGISTAVDNDSGTGTADQLTFGVRSLQNAGADAKDYDGRNGELLAGTYYLAVAPVGSSFAGAFTVTPSANPGGAYTLNLTTNTNGGSLPTLFPPVITGVDYDLLGGPIDPNLGFEDARPGTAAAIPVRGVLWDKFTLANPTDASHYLDVDFFALSGTGADGMAFLFNSAGDLVAVSDDEGFNAQPQFSSGEPGPRTRGGNTVPFDGNTPVGMPFLSAGTYYMARGLWPCDYLDLQIVPDRFHVRGTSGSSLNIDADIYAGGGGGGPACDPDVNQDGNVDQDDVSYLINVVGGGDNPTGIDPDFNQDGNVDQDDISSLINTVAGGPCPG